MDNTIQITATSGLLLYGAFVNTAGQYLNTASRGYEAMNANNWASYVVPLVEAVPNSGIYFAPPPPTWQENQWPATGLFPVYCQANVSPASTDNTLNSNSLGVGGLILAISQKEALCPLVITTLAAPSATAPGTLPQLQYSARTWQAILNKRIEWAMKSPTGLQAVTIDGQQVQYRSPAQNQQEIEWLIKKVAILTGRRRRSSTINLSHF